MKAETATKIRAILSEDLFVEIPEDQIGIDDALRAEVGLDSLGFVELRLQCERAFRVKIPDEEFSPDNFRSIRCLGELLERMQVSQGMPKHA